MARRTYQLHEANQVLPRVRRLVGQVVELSGQVDELTDHVRIAEYRMRRPGSGTEDRERFEESTAALRGAEEDLVTALGGLEELGVQLKDPRIGLVDFLSYREKPPWFTAHSSTGPAAARNARRCPSATEPKASGAMTSNWPKSPISRNPAT